MTRIEQLAAYLRDAGLEPTVEGDGLEVLYEGSTVRIATDEDDPRFLAIRELWGIDWESPEERIADLELCNDLSNKYKFVKCVLTPYGLVASAEADVPSLDDYAPSLLRQVDVVHTVADEFFRTRDRRRT